MMCLDRGFVRGKVSARLLAAMLHLFSPTWSFLVPRESSLHSTEGKEEIKMSPGCVTLGSGLPFLCVLPVPGVFGNWVKKKLIFQQNQFHCDTTW